MGLYDREYYRDDYARRERWQFGTVTIALAVATTLPFLVQIAIARPFLDPIYHDPLMRAGGFVLDKILAGEVWRLITSVFLHDSLGANLWILGGGLMILIFCGQAVESTYGSKETFWFYVASILVTQIALLAASIVKPFQFVPPDPGYGCGGPTTAILVLFACLARDTKIPVLFVSLRAGHVAAAVILLNLLLFVSSGFRHAPAIPVLIGAGFAFAYHRFNWRVSNWIPNLPGLRADVRPTQVKSRPLFQDRVDEADPLELLRPTPNPVAVVAKSEPPTPRPSSVDEQLEAQLDQVLAKMSQYGRQSLTDQEHDILKRASEIYKKRRS